jgi:hypothetical protein
MGQPGGDLRDAAPGAPQQLISNWPKPVRHEHCDHNYLEAMHRVAGVPYELQVRFFPTDEERTWALRARAALGARPGGGVRAVRIYGAEVLAVRGRARARLAERKVHVVIVGDTRGMKFEPRGYVHVKGMGEWTVRKSLAFAQCADAVVGQESILTNSVCVEPMRKVVLLSHSSRRTSRAIGSTRGARWRGAVLPVPSDSLHDGHVHQGSGQWRRGLPVRDLRRGGARGVGRCDQRAGARCR